MTASTTATSKDLVISWLNDALATEIALTKVLEERVKDAKGIAIKEEMARQHLEETKRHAELVKGCIERLGGSPSKVKSVLGNMIGMIEGPMTNLYKDEMIKNCLMDYAAEHFEIASYRALTEAANAIGDQETARICTEIEAEERAMAQRIMAQLPADVAMELQKPR